MVLCAGHVPAPVPEAGAAQVAAVSVACGLPNALSSPKSNDSGGSNGTLPVLPQAPRRWCPARPARGRSRHARWNGTHANAACRCGPGRGWVRARGARAQPGARGGGSGTSLTGGRGRPAMGARGARREDTTIGRTCLRLRNMLVLIRERKKQRTLQYPACRNPRSLPPHINRPRLMLPIVLLLLPHIPHPNCIVLLSIQ
ncbi:hypothetical protein B0H16DRAFT_560910 [Mycena metata]|uniref:Uncharacterized protein n=1 Tax=Mycena metata TaxID=1033252 RepID=A0AAD7H5S2_9AGAR|nr:hypothetical protein B0H16DRAFT_560910 [Mycena metata]